MALVSVVCGTTPAGTASVTSVTSAPITAQALADAVSPFFGDLGSKYMLDPATAEIGKAAGYSDGFAFYMKAEYTTSASTSPSTPPRPAM